MKAGPFNPVSIYARPARAEHRNRSPEMVLRSI
jgi:hypothetical protein